MQRAEVVSNPKLAAIERRAARERAERLRCNLDVIIQ
jgi:hypothetical protein